MTKYRISTTGSVDEKLWEAGYEVSLLTEIFGICIIKYKK